MNAGRLARDTGLLLSVGNNIPTLSLCSFVSAFLLSSFYSFSPVAFSVNPSSDPCLHSVRFPTHSSYLFSGEIRVAISFLPFSLNAGVRKAFAGFEGRGGGRRVRGGEMGEQNRR